MSTESSNKTTDSQGNEPSAEHRLAVRNAWLSHPDVVRYIDAHEHGPATWIDFAHDEIETDGPRNWSIPTRAELLQWAAVEGVGMAGLADADRAIIRHEYRVCPAHRRDPETSCWLLVQDAETKCPLDLPSTWTGDDPNPEWRTPAQAWAAEYRARLPVELSRFGMVVSVEPGTSPILGVWIGRPHAPKMLREWIGRIGGARDYVNDFGFDKNDPGRFVVLGSTCGVDNNQANYVALPPPTASTQAGKSFTIVSTGIAPFDALLATCGIPRGARVIVQADTANAKSIFDLQIAEYLGAAGYRVAWIATADESVESINARRLQKIGYERKDATVRALIENNPTLAKLNQNLEVIDGRNMCLEEVIASAPDFLFIDPIQKVRTRAGANRGQLESISAAIDLIENSGITTFCTAAKVRGSARRARIEGAYGGSAIERGATLLLDLVLDGDALRVAVLKSRYGGEGESFDLLLDREGQKLMEPASAFSVADKLEPVRRAVHAAIKKHGPLSGRGVERWVRARAADIRTALEELEAAGEIIRDGTRFAIPGTP